MGLMSYRYAETRRFVAASMIGDFFDSTGRFASALAMSSAEDVDRS